MKKTKHPGSLQLDGVKHSVNEKVSATVVMTALRKDASPIIKKVKKLKIDSKDNYNEAAIQLKQLKQLAKIAKEKEESLTQPILKVVEGIRDLFRPFRDEVKTLETNAKASMFQFNVKAATEIKKLETNFGTAKGVKKVSTLLEKTSALSTGNTRKTWQSICVNEAQTPREYLIPDEGKIRNALKEGKSVKGWKWEQVESIAI